MIFLLVHLLAATPTPTPGFVEVPAAEGAPATADAPEIDGRKLLLKCEKRFLKIESMKGTIRDQIIHHDGSDDASTPPQPITSDFVYVRGALDKGVEPRIRFENVRPLPHSVIWNGDKLWIWSPQENAVVEEPAKDVPMTVRAAFGVQPGFGIDHLAPIPIDAYRADVKRVVAKGKDVKSPSTGHLVVTLTPIDNQVPRATMQLVVDPEKLYVTRILTLVGQPGGGAIALSDVELTQPVEVAPGTWFPTRVHSLATIGDGTQIEQVRTYERLKFNLKVEDTKFSFQIPEGATKIPLAMAAGLSPGPEKK